MNTQEIKLIAPNLLGYIKRAQDFLEYLCRSSEGEALSHTMDTVCELLIEALKNGAPILVCGNGGSAADAMHIAGELVGRFKHERKALPVIALSSDSAILTCLGNDYGYESIFARQVEAYAQPGSVLIGISTSGNSPNVIRAFEMAKSMDVKTVGLTGNKGGKLAPLCDHLLDIPSTSTPEIQEAHVLCYHYLCAQVEKAFIHSNNV